MSAPLAFLVLILALVGGAVMLSVLVILRRGPAASYLALAALLVALAAGVWLTTLRTPPPMP
jgi:hypothetical protein